MKKKKLHTPILLLVFNRPEKTQLVFDVIRNVEPTKLYIAVDAPREHNLTDLENCKKVLEIVKNVDWKCEVKYLIQEKNLGCTLSGKTAWDWFFSHEDKMIFIEDDGLVSKSFFFFCQELLNKYQFDNRIAYIGGMNYDFKYGNSSYFFSILPAATFAMATWKRVYELYEYKMETYESYKSQNKFKSNFPHNFAYKFVVERFDNFINYGGNTYDIQMNYLAFKHKMYSIYPNINLVSNIGLDGGANNNSSSDSKLVKRFGNKRNFEIEKILHPSDVEVNSIIEKVFFFKRIFWSKYQLFLVILQMYLPFIYDILSTTKRKLTFRKYD